MRVLITGGAGFQGSHLVEILASAGHEITVLNTYSLEAERNLRALTKEAVVVWGSVTDTEVVEKTVRGQDVVIHLAARINVDESIEAAPSFVAVNVMGTQNILEAARKHEARVLFASSCEVYGYVNDDMLSESSELRPHSPYAASKAGADRLCFAYWKTFGTDVTIIRPCNIYGASQKAGSGGAVIPIFVRRALAGQPLRVFGTGGQRREYMHVSDLARAYELVLARDDLGGEVFNFGTGETASVREIAEFIVDKVGGTVEDAPARPGEVAGFVLDSSRAAALGFAPRVSFWTGLADYVREEKAAAAGR